MINPAYDEVLRADAETRLGLFTATAQRLGTTPQNVEKDFWVCWTLDALFNGLPPGGPRLLFKGGTSLSKGFGLISRFSEDIDVTVFRDDLGQGASVEQLAALSRTRRHAKLDAIRAAGEAYVQGDLREQLEALAREAVQRTGLDRVRRQISPRSQQFAHAPTLCRPRGRRPRPRRGQRHRRRSGTDVLGQGGDPAWASALV